MGPPPSPRADSVCPPGLDIHFIHVKPPQPLSGCTPKPLLMVHGWPGSFYEFYKIIPLLTDPRKHGLSDEHVFEVICPCIPGYGFSEASSKKGTVAGAGGWLLLGARSSHRRGDSRDSCPRGLGSQMASAPSLALLGAAGGGWAEQRSLAASAGLGAWTLALSGAPCPGAGPPLGPGLSQGSPRAARAPRTSLVPARAHRALAARPSIHHPRLPRRCQAHCLLGTGHTTLGPQASSSPPVSCCHPSLGQEGEVRNFMEAQEDPGSDLSVILFSFAFKPGLNSVATARIFYKLMLRLGFQEFYIQGGDWGSLICTNMAQMVPR